MPDKQNTQPLYEVLTDTWGYEPQFVKGDLIRKGDAPYDFDHAENMGSIRLAPEYEGTHVASATEPLNPDGTIDQNAQDIAAAGASIPRAEDRKTAGAAQADAAAKDK